MRVLTMYCVVVAVPWPRCGENIVLLYVLRGHLAYINFMIPSQDSNSTMVVAVGVQLVDINRRLHGENTEYNASRNRQPVSGG